MVRVGHGGSRRCCTRLSREIRLSVRYGSQFMNRAALAVVLFSIAVACFADTSRPLLLQRPTLNSTHIVFSYAGDLWSVPRQGGDAVRLTVGPGIETNPIFSPDGTQIAFQGEYDGNTDMYIMPASGGVPK